MIESASQRDASTTTTKLTKYPSWIVSQRDALQSGLAYIPHSPFIPPQIEGKKTNMQSAKNKTVEDKTAKEHLATKGDEADKAMGTYFAAVFFFWSCPTATTKVQSRIIYGTR
jgi:hypothetical protein